MSPRKPLLRPVPPPAGDAPPGPTPAQPAPVPLTPAPEKIGESRDNLAARGRAWAKRAGRDVR